MLLLLVATVAGTSARQADDLVCLSGEVRLGDGRCQRCDMIMVGCSLCEEIGACLVCGKGYSLSPATKLCENEDSFGQTVAVVVIGVVVFVGCFYLTGFFLMYKIIDLFVDLWKISREKSHK